MKRSIGIILLTMVLLGSITYGYEKPDAKTIWTNATPGNRQEPGGSKKNTGYVAGERPGFKTWNWLIYNLGLWTNYLEDVTDTLKTSSTTADGYIGQTGDIGIGTSTPTAKAHIVSTGTGTDVAFQIDTTQQNKAIYVSSSGVVEIASATVQNQTVEQQTVTNQTITNLAVSSEVVTYLTATNIKNTQLSSGNSAVDVLTSSQITITPASAVVGLTIDQNEDEVGLKVDSEATSGGKWGILVNAKYGIESVQDIADGRGLTVYRLDGLEQIESHPLVFFNEQNAEATQPVLEITNAGSGEDIIASGIGIPDLLYDIHRQDIAANSAKTDQTVRKGWTFKDGGGVPTQTIVITFGITFDEPPIVLVSACGSLINVDPTTIDDLNAVGLCSVNCYGITTTGCTIIISGLDGANLANARRYGATWVAIGTLAR